MYTFTKAALPVNQPLSLGNLKAVVGELNVTSYLNPGGATITPESVGFSKIAFIQPLDATTDSLNHAFNSAGNVLTYVTLANPGVEAADTVDVGAMTVIIWGV